MLQQRSYAPIVWIIVTNGSQLKGVLWCESGQEHCGSYSCRKSGQTNVYSLVSCVQDTVMHTESFAHVVHTNGLAHRLVDNHVCTSGPHLGGMLGT